MLPSKETYADWADHRLLEQYRSSLDQRALSVLIDRYRVQVLGRCVQLMGNWQDAEDACQNTFEDFTKLAQSTTTIDVVPALLYQIASRRSIDKLRRQQRLAKLQAHIEADTKKNSASFVENPDLVRQSIELSEKEARLRKALSQLPDLQRECIQRFYFEKASYRQIAEALALPLKKVKSALQTGKRRLRLILSELQD